jgi:hypothetical protein
LPDDWANESFSIAQADVYGDPPLSKDAPQLGGRLLTAGIWN